MRAACSLLALMLAFLARTAGAAPAPASLEPGEAERLLVVSPHPDDETLGAGGLVQRVLARGGSVDVALVTAGDGYVEAVVHETGLLRPRPAQFVAYGERRLLEARAALHALGDDRIKLEFLGFPDGGLMGLLREHWRRIHPERSLTTGVADPPYTDAVEPDVPYAGSDLRRELTRILEHARPTIVVLPDPLDRHPDHRATGLFTLLAIEEWTSKKNRPGPMPRLLAYLIHWPGWPPGWDDSAPTPSVSVVTLTLPADLPAAGAARPLLTLTDAEVATKRAALARYTSQQEVMAPLLAAFIRRTEPFTELSAAVLQGVGEMVERSAEPQPLKAR